MKHRKRFEAEVAAPQSAGRPGGPARVRPGEAAIVLIVAALIVAASWPAIKPASPAARTAPAPPASAPSPNPPVVIPTTATPRPAQTGILAPPPGTGGWNGAAEPVELNPVTLIHATGAELTWAPFHGGDGQGDVAVAAYGIYRGTTPDFTLSPATRVANVAATRDTFTDTTASAGGDYFYLVAAQTSDGRLIPSSTQFVHLPPSGQAEVALHTKDGATLNAQQPDSNDSAVDFPLHVTPDAGLGAKRAVIQFGSLTPIPAGAAVTGARLRVGSDDAACDPSFIAAYPLTRSFVSSQVTWDSAAAGAAWGQPGGSYTTPAGPPLTGAAADTNPDTCEFDVTSIVRHWLSASWTPHGFLLKFIKEKSQAGLGSFPETYEYATWQGPELELDITYTAAGRKANG